jgi:hypothetical protein
LLSWNAAPIKNKLLTLSNSFARSCCNFVVVVVVILVAQPCSALLSLAQPCSALLSLAQPCSALLSLAQPCSALLSLAQFLKLVLRTDKKSDFQSCFVTSQGRNPS